MYGTLVSTLGKQSGSSSAESYDAGSPLVRRAVLPNPSTELTGWRRIVKVVSVAEIR